MNPTNITNTNTTNDNDNSNNNNNHEFWISSSFVCYVTINFAANHAGPMLIWQFAREQLRWLFPGPPNNA